MSGLAEPTPKGQFTLYDFVVSPSNVIGHFDMLTGGDQAISMVKYNVIDDKGNVTTKFIPGQTSFEPMVLLRSMDLISEQIYKKFYAAVEGQLKNIRKNYSVSMNDAKGNPLIIWDLANALPTKVSGFSFNMTTEAEYTSFEITLQAELITVTFLPQATAEAVAQSIEYWMEKESGESE